MRFLENQRVAVHFEKFTARLASDGEKRVGLGFTLELDEKIVPNCPHFVQSGFEQVSKPANSTKAVQFVGEIDKQNILFFSTPGQDSATIHLPAVDLTKMSVEERPTETGTKVVLVFHVWLRWDKAIWGWAGDYIFGGIWAEFEESQAEIPGTESDAPVRQERPKPRRVTRAIGKKVKAAKAKPKAKAARRGH